MKKLAPLALLFCAGCVTTNPGNFSNESQTYFSGSPTTTSSGVSRDIGFGRITDYVSNEPPIMASNYSTSDTGEYDPAQAQQFQDFAARMESHRLMYNKPEFGPAHRHERHLWAENAYTSPQIFSHSGAVEAEIRDRTRGANFFNPNERRRAEEIAQQVRESAWNRQVQIWNRQIDRQQGRNRR